MSDLIVRPYRPEDRVEVRRICHQTGFMGEPADWYWRDETSFANIWTRYYTDVEPESAFVVEDGTEVLGYLLGCVDTSRAPSDQRAISRELVRRWLLLRPGTSAFFRRAIRDVMRGPRIPSLTPDASQYPSHLHIDLLPSARGQGAGRRLIEAWFERLAAALARLPPGHPGREHGRDRVLRGGRFRRHRGPKLIPGMRTRTGERMHAQIMVRAL